MSKALVIKGANFATNKVETITIEEVIPCTGISITPTTVTFNTLNATQQITPTLTPNDTTETVYYESSNTDIITVSASGLITCVGVGSATVTATCGNQSASCTITSAITINANTALTAVDLYNVGGSDMSGGKDYISYYSSSKSRAYLSPDATESGYQAVSGASAIPSPWDALYPIMLPGNTSKISVSAPSGLKNHVNIILLDSTSHPTYSMSYKGAKALTNSIEIKATMELELSSYSGYDSFALVFQTTGADSSTITGDVTIAFT